MRSLLIKLSFGLLVLSLSLAPFFALAASNGDSSTTDPLRRFLGNEDGRQVNIVSLAKRGDSAGILIELRRREVNARGLADQRLYGVLIPGWEYKEIPPLQKEEIQEAAQALVDYYVSEDVHDQVLTAFLSLVDLGADINTKDSYRHQPILFRATKHGAKATAEVLSRFPNLDDINELLKDKDSPYESKDVMRKYLRHQTEVAGNFLEESLVENQESIKQEESLLRELLVDPAMQMPCHSGREYPLLGLPVSSHSHTHGLIGMMAKLSRLVKQALGKTIVPAEISEPMPVELIGIMAEYAVDPNFEDQDYQTKRRLWDQYVKSYAGKKTTVEKWLLDKFEI